MRSHGLLHSSTNYILANRDQLTLLGVQGVNNGLGPFCAAVSLIFCICFVNSHLTHSNFSDQLVLQGGQVTEVGAYIDRITPAWSITSACENPEGVFKYFIEAMQDGGDVQYLFTYGVEGKHWSQAAETLWEGTDKEKTYEEGQWHFLPNAEKPETAYTKAHIDPMLALVDLEAPENSVTDVALAAQELFNANCKSAFIVPSTDEMSPRDSRRQK